MRGKQPSSWDSPANLCLLYFRQHNYNACHAAGPQPPPAHPPITTSIYLQCGNAGVQPSSLIELAKRALALTVHQLALYRKVGFA